MFNVVPLLLGYCIDYVSPPPPPHPPSGWSGRGTIYRVILSGWNRSGTVLIESSCLVGVSFISFYSLKRVGVVFIVPSSLVIMILLSVVIK